MKDTKENRFLQLKRLSHIFSDTAKPIGEGLSGIVIDMGDGTISKFYEFNAAHQRREISQKGLSNEAKILKIFGGSAGEFKLPRLVEDETFFERDSPLGQKFIGSIRMTKIEGNAVDHADIENKPPHKIKDYFYQKGMMLAALHEASKKYDVPDPIESQIVNPLISAPWLRDPQMVDILNACNDWFTQRQIVGFAHGDLAGTNVKVDENFHITGVLDFTCSGKYANRLTDLSKIWFEYLPDAIKGYKAISNSDINLPFAQMAHIHILGIEIMALNHIAEQKEKLAEPQADFQEWLKGIAQDLALV